MYSSLGYAQKAHRLATLFSRRKNVYDKNFDRCGEAIERVADYVVLHKLDTSTAATSGQENAWGNIQKSLLAEATGVIENYGKSQKKCLISLRAFLACMHQERSRDELDNILSRVSALVTDFDLKGTQLIQLVEDLKKLAVDVAEILAEVGADAMRSRI